jgi:hypothetical protein
MNNEELLNRYQELNSSYRRKLIFHFGGDKGAGFYSEFNSLLLAVLFALHYKLQFVLYSKDCHFSFNNGWNEFFEDFCPTYKNDIIGRCIGRTYLRPGNRRLQLYKLFSNNLIENDIYSLCRSSFFEHEFFNIPELGIKGDIKTALKILIPIIYRFNKNYQTLINQFVNELSLPSNYITMHIRGGDKSRERKLIDPDFYLMKAEQLSECRNAFVFTDDYRLFKRLQQNHPNWQMFTSTSPDENGHDSNTYLKQSEEIIRRNFVELFASVEIASSSDLFIGTYSSNIGLFIGIMNENMIGVDFDNWLII